MASLHIVKGANQGTQVPLDQEKIVLGRNPDCHVVIPITSVSREHAHILCMQGRYFIEDMQSRNGTYVNNQPITARTALQHNDRIRICDFQATFYDASQLQPLRPELMRGESEPEPEEAQESSSTVEAMVSHSSNLILESQPAEKLKALLEISGNLSRTLQLDPLLPKIVDTLFQVFKQADRAFIILSEIDSARLIPKVIKTRRPQDESNARFSRSIVKRCLESAQAFLSDDASADKNLPLTQSVVDFRIRSVMCAPLCGSDGKAFGVIQLDTQDRSKKFTHDDLKLLVGVANQAATALENAKLHETMMARERFRRDMELAQQVQFSFLPKELPAVPSFEFFAHYEPAQEVGGDYYDFIPLPSHRLAVTLGDVAGKGIPAALLMAKLAGDVRYCLLSEAEPALAISKLNDAMTPHLSQMDRFVTLAAAVLDPEKSMVTLVNAGHLTPLLYRRSDGSLQDMASKESAGLPLGVLEEQKYEASQVELQPGDCLLLFTDGVPDAVNARNVAFGTKGVHAALQEGGPFTARLLGEKIVKCVKQHVAGHSRADDVTLVCLGRTVP